MAQPKSGISHTRGSLYLGSALNASGNARIVGTLRIDGGVVTGGIYARSLATGSNGPIFSAGLGRPLGSTHSAASGTIIWSFAPPRNIRVREISLAFPASGPQGGRFGIKMFTLSVQGTAVSKATASVSIGTGAKSFLRFTSLTPTCNVGRAFGIAVLSVGGTVAGRGGRAMVHYTYN